MPGLTARYLALVLLVAFLAAAPSASAQVAAQLSVERSGATTRLIIAYPERLGGEISAQAEIAGGAVLVATLSEPASFDPSQIPAESAGLAAMARLDPDGRTLRVALNREAEPRISVSHNVIAIDLAPPGASPLPDIVSPFEQNRRAEAAAAAERAREAANVPPPPPEDVTVRVGEAADYTRLEFTWPRSVEHRLETSGERSQLMFARPGQIDLRPVSASPPRLLDSISARNGEDGLEISVGVEEGARTRVWAEGSRVVLDILAPGAVTPEALLAALSDAATNGADAALSPTDDAATDDDDAAARQAQAALEAEIAAEAAQSASRPDPVPENGVVRARVARDGNDVSVTFEWAHLPGLAVFRRTGAYWVVFDAAATLDMAEFSGLPRRHITDHTVFSGPDYVALRIETPDATQADVSAAGAAWTLALRDMVDEPPRSVRVSRETPINQPARVRISHEGARASRRVADPVAGDTLLVLTADGEKRGMVSAYRLVEASFLPSVHGVAIQPAADDLELTVRPGGADLSRPGGMVLSRAASPGSVAGSAQPTSPAFLDLEGWRGNGDFVAGLQDAQRRASSGEPDALLALARYYLAWELAPEALAAARLAAEARPGFENSPEMRALMGVAQLMIGRDARADVLLSGSVLNQDPVVQPWRGLVSARRQDWAEARRRFDEGAASLYFFDPVWQARVRAAHARAAIETNDVSAARAIMAAFDDDEPDLQAAAEAGYVSARIAALSGDTSGAIERFDALSRSPWEPIQAAALLEKLRLEIAERRISVADAAEALESLRFRWRGDATELEAARMLGDLYAEAGRYHDALSVMEAARHRQPGSLTSRRMAGDMDRLFRRLFLEDEASRMSPVEALALYNEFSTLTPQGADGDRMVRRVADRLVAVDLLDPAAALLQHQVDNRSMPGNARARIASDLAVIYLMGRRHEDALRTLRATRMAGLNEDLVTERRLLEARALAGLGRREHALELIEADDNAAARRLRADIAWEQRDWANAGRGMEALLGARWRDEEPLDGVEAQDVLRASIAYALAGDRPGLDRLEARYRTAMAQTRHAGAFNLVVSDITGAGDRRLNDLVSSIAGRDTMDAFLAGFARRFESGES
ncbi:tetratricopeptide repeat protein [Glycocaulis sp.]